MLVILKNAKNFKTWKNEPEIIQELKHEHQQNINDYSELYLLVKRETIRRAGRLGKGISKLV